MTNDGAMKALRAERAIRRQAEADKTKLVAELATLRLQLTKLGAENQRIREDNHHLTGVNRSLEKEQRRHTEAVRRRDQTISALRVQLSERSNSND